MDELTLVARLREDLPDGVDLTGPERRLAAEISAAASDVADGMGRTRRLRKARGTGTGAAGGKRRYGRRIVTVAVIAVAAAAAALAAVVVVQNQPAYRLPGATGSPSPSAAPVPGPAVTAAQLVAYATRAAATAPLFDPKPDEWIYSKTLAATSSAGEGGMLFGPPDGRAVQQSWNRVDGRQQAYLQHGKLVFSSLLPAGAVAPAPGGWPNISYPYLDSLPSNPARLKAVIEAGLKAQNYVIGSGNTGIFNAIQALIENVVLPLKLRASLYGVLASDPAVHFDPRVADFAGQTGVAFYTYQEGYLKQELVINPRTYAFMGRRDVAYRSRNLPEAINNGVASGPTIHIRKGQVTGEFAVLESGIVQHAGQVP
jgi:hypothetical protein